MTEARLRLGRRAELLVRHRLESQGWSVIAANARTRRGELDLIALDGTELVFVEVKAGRAGGRSGPERPALAVGRDKQRRLRLLAREWLAGGESPSGVSGYRFDVVGVTFEPSGGVEVDHIRAAF